MKENKAILFTLLLSLFTIVSACSDKDKDEENKDSKENSAINEWIYEEMSFKYFWYDKVPSATSLNFNLEPDDFFYKTLYRYNLSGGDRFSYLEKDDIPYFPARAESYKASKQDIGFEYHAYQDINTKQITLLVTYVKKGTNAEKDGLKRGDWIQSVDGVKLNINNWFSILNDGKSSYKLDFQNRTSLTVNATNGYAESPVLLSKTLDLDGKKVGYIVYNRFANDENDKTMSYALEMNNIFKSLQSEKINELILDLRYNPGGLVESGNYIASALVPNRNAAGRTIYTKRAFNKKYDEYLRQYSNYEELITEKFHEYINNKDEGGSINEAIPKLNIQKLYVLTSQYTASASEQIINGLSVYIPELTVIGETTTGKNMESFSIEDKKNKENNWILHPLTSVSFNSKVNLPEDNDYSGGIEPTNGTEVSEIEYIAEKVYELGDPNERLLAEAINNILGAKARVKRSMSAKPEQNVRSLGGSLDRKSNSMIINDPSKQ